MKDLNVLIVHRNTLLGSENTMIANVIVVSVAIRPLLIQLTQFFIALEKAMSGLRLLIVCSKAIPCENLLKS